MFFYSSIAKWQPEISYPVELDKPGKHVMTVVFFTPEGISPDGTELAVSAGDHGGESYFMNIPILCQRHILMGGPLYILYLKSILFYGR